MANTEGTKVLVVMGSVRAGRLCPRIADWVKKVAEAAAGGLAFELVDLADWPLPMDDEAGIPRRGVYEHAHTRAWSAKVASRQGFIFVTPQYNWGYPAPLKNALDHLYQEWVGKPAVIVSYGGHGGGKCAEQLRQVIGAMEMKPVATMPGLTITREMMMGGAFEPDKDFAGSVETVRTAVKELASSLKETVEGRQ